MQPSELYKVEQSTLLRFARATEVLVTFGCNGDVHWAKLSNGLSIMSNVHPEVKYQAKHKQTPVKMVLPEL